MDARPFIGREAELSRLRELLKLRCANLVVVRGRRRIGKSRLLMEFGTEMKSFFFSGIPPTRDTSAQSQREEFARQMQAVLNAPLPRADNWGDLFWVLSEKTSQGEVLVVLDEISWMGGKDPSFLSHLKTAWDLHFSKNPNLIMVLCGSISSWIEKNILSNTGFVGRIALDLVLQELPLDSCNEFWQPNSSRISSYEKFKILSVTGGVPFYLEHIRPDKTAEENLQRLCFRQGGLLVKEFDEIFSDLFSKSKASHKQIISFLADGAKEFNQICAAMGKSPAGTYSKHLDELIKAGFVKREHTWDLSTAKKSLLSRYRLSDNYIRFYLKTIQPNKDKIDKGVFAETQGVHIPGWDTMLGLQFENLVANNYKLLWHILGIRPERILMEGPFFQTRTQKRKGCQIDYLIQTTFNTVYLCEIKFSKRPVSTEVISQVQEKIDRLDLPKGFSIRPVLIHVNGVEESIESSEFFDQVIDFGLFLSSHKSPKR